MFRKKKKNAGEPKRPAFLEKNKEFSCSLEGRGELYIENYGSLGNFCEDRIVLRCYQCEMVIEGERLAIEYFTDVDMKITGRIRSIHF